jgi:hypothetical protein
LIFRQISRILVEASVESNQADARKSLLAHYSTKQLLSQETEKLVIQRGARNSISGGRVNQGKLTAKKVMKKDFFGRFLAEDSSATRSNGSAAPDGSCLDGSLKKVKISGNHSKQDGVRILANSVSTRIFYKFNEGFSNSVRKTAKIKEFL